MSIQVESATDRPIEDIVGEWAAAAGVDPKLLPTPQDLQSRFDQEFNPCRSPASPRVIADWERRHGFRLPKGLRAWLLLSDGCYLDGPVIHPIMAIGPMIPFARVPGLLVQPESWFELGNPSETDTICIDLAYRWPGGDRPIFTSGDDLVGRMPRLIAPSFESWFLRLLHEGGNLFWLDPEYPALGDPWTEHRRRTPPPPLPSRLRRLLSHTRPLMRHGADERAIASTLGVTPLEVEALFRHLQHSPVD